jgi:hypothetical protein
MHLVKVIIQLMLSFGLSYLSVNVNIWGMVMFSEGCHSFNNIIWLMLSFGLCYHLVYVIIRFMLSFG